MIEYQTREKIEISITGFNGAPIELYLELTLPDETVQVLKLGVDAAIQDNATSGYIYDFVAADNQKGIWLYRWYGKDFNGNEFSRPTDRARESLSIG